MITQKELPESVNKLVQLFNAWIVGGAANVDNTISCINDIDVVVSYSQWSKAVALIPKDARKNTFGGWKYKEGEYIIDVWPDDLASLLCSSHCKYLWQPKHNIRYKKQYTV